MATPLKLLCVLAHPDDESLGFGGTIAHYAAQGVDVHLLTATRGQQGWAGPEHEYPGVDRLSEIRERELQCAARTLGVRQLHLLDYQDGKLDQVDRDELVGQVVNHVRSIRPDVVVTFGPDGAYGHPDHIMISQQTTAALICASDSDYEDCGSLPAHRVSKLYHRLWTRAGADTYAATFGEVAISVDGTERTLTAWPDWVVTTHLDTSEHWHTVQSAVLCHRSQLPGDEPLSRLSGEAHRQLWGRQDFYRAFSLVGAPSSTETDLFAGLR